MSARPLVVLTDVTDIDPGPAVTLLEAAGCDALILDLVTNRSVPSDARRAVAGIVGFARIDGALLAQLPDLRILATTSTGIDMVDAAAAAERGIEVVGLDGASTVEVATHALLLMLAPVRDLPTSQQTVRDGGWTDDASTVPRAADELTVGLVGYGRIAQATASRARPMFGRVIAYDPHVGVAGDADPASLEEIFATADIVSLHLPVLPETAGIVSAARIGAMRPGAILVNVSRGELVDHAAVLAALDDGRLGAYAADVLDGEPPSRDDPLRRHPRAIITPHIAYRSDRSLERYALQPARTILQRLGLPAIHRTTEETTA